MLGGSSSGCYWLQEWQVGAADSVDKLNANTTVAPTTLHHSSSTSTFERNHYDVGMYRGGSEAYKRCGLFGIHYADSFTGIVALISTYITSRIFSGSTSWLKILDEANTFFRLTYVSNSNKYNYYGRIFKQQTYVSNSNKYNYYGRIFKQRISDKTGQDNILKILRMSSKLWTI